MPSETQHSAASVKKQIKTEVLKRVQRNGESHPYQANVYDEAGNIVRAVHYYESGAVLSESEYSYEDNRLVLEKTFGEYGDCTEIRHTYNDAGILILKETIYSDGSTEREEKNLADHQEHTRFLDGDGNQFGEVIVFFDQQGRELGSEVYENGELQEKQTLELDDAGRTLKRTTGNPAGGQTRITTFQYDTDGRVAEELDTDAEDQVLRKTTNTYEDGKIMTQVIEDRTGNRITTECQYDERDQLIRQTSLNQHGDILFDVEFEYNEYGDRIRTVTINRSSRQGMQSEEAREIEYY